METLKLVRLDRRRIGDFERLLAGKEFGGCYCTRFTAYDPGWAERCIKAPKENLALTRTRILEGLHAGYLAFREMDGTAVGWTAAGPKTCFPRLQELPGSRLGPTEERVWVVACLAVGFPYRGLGYGRRMVELLIEEARRAGASAVEAYPLDPEDVGQAHRGSRSFYEALGFSQVASEADGERQCLRMEKKLSEVPVA